MRVCLEHTRRLAELHDRQPPRHCSIPTKAKEPGGVPSPALRARPYIDTPSCRCAGGCAPPSQQEWARRTARRAPQLPAADSAKQPTPHHILLAPLLALPGSVSLDIFRPAPQLLLRGRLCASFSAGEGSSNGSPCASASCRRINQVAHSTSRSARSSARPSARPSR